MTNELIFDALEYIDDDLLEDVGNLRTQKRTKPRHTWMRVLSAAACICIILGGVFVSGHYFSQFFGGSDGAAPEMAPEIDTGGYSGHPDSVESGVTVPKTEVSLKPNESADMIGFFIYGDRMYVEYARIDGNPALVGDYVGTSNGLIDEWTPEDGYVDYAGSISGDFYAVNGYDPSFMLCMTHDDGMVTVYVNDNGMTLYRGADLFEERLHLTGNFEAVEYQTRHDWYYSLGNVKELSVLSADADGFEDFYGTADQTGSGSALDVFLSELNNGNFMYTDHVPLADGQKNIYDLEIYHLFFRMNDGMTVHLRLYEGGYVRFDGLIPVCVKMDTAAFDALVAELK